MNMADRDGGSIFCGALRPRHCPFGVWPRPLNPPSLRTPPSTSGDTPLYNALKKGSTEHLLIADVLLRSGADPFIRRTPDDTPDWAWSAWEVCLSETMTVGGNGHGGDGTEEGLAIATLCLNTCRRVYRRPFGKKRQRVVEYSSLGSLLGVTFENQSQAELNGGGKGEVKSEGKGEGKGEDEGVDDGVDGVGTATDANPSLEVEGGGTVLSGRALDLSLVINR